MTGGFHLSRKDLADLELLLNSLNDIVSHSFRVESTKHLVLRGHVEFSKSLI